MASLGDRVKIKSSVDTIAAGVADREADVCGFTTPSVTGVEVIGGAPDDHAISIETLGGNESYWIRPDLVEVIHHNPGMEIVIGKVRAVREPDGSWTESVISPRQNLSDKLTGPK